MKIVIASDIHGSEKYTEELVKRIEEEKPDRVLLLGDLLYHGPRNDLPCGYQPKRVIEILNGMKERLFCVRGNCEAEVDQMVLSFPVMADYAVIPVKNRMIYATHGHNYSQTTPPPLMKGDILLAGHTHIPKCEMCEGFIYMNPGSVSIPKNGSEHSYMTYEDGVFQWKKLFGGETYMRYSIENA
ncbi:MAG: phosphodiesterase [Clostridia bacterium]|nr:phosphodiesterase [Clostridia bacterium]